MTLPAMIRPPHLLHAILPVTACLLLAASATAAEVPAHLVLLNGRAIPLSAVALQGGNFVVKTAFESFAVGATIARAIHGSRECQCQRGSKQRAPRERRAPSACRATDRK